MRRSFALTTMAWLSLVAIGCGTSTTTSSTQPSSTAATPATSSATTSTAAGIPPSGGYSRNDGDEDFDDKADYHGSPPNDDRALLATYGPKASPAVTQTVSSLVKRYYAASAAGDAPTACSLITVSLAEGLVNTQSQPGGGKPHTCAAAMAQFLSQQHAQLLGEDVSTMKVSSVHVKGALGLAVLAFKTAPESEIVLEREGSTWKIDALVGNDMT